MPLTEKLYSMARRMPFKEVALPFKALRGTLRNRGLAFPAFVPGTHGAGELRIHESGVPVLTVEGRPYEMGYQHGRLLAPQIAMLYDRYLSVFAGRFGYDLRLSRKMEHHIPRHFQDEIRGLGDGSGVGYERALVAACFLDLHKIAACSTFLVHSQSSAEDDGELVMGRNLDFPSLGLAHHSSMLIRFRPEGRREHVSVTWPGFVGTLSGMNRDGLALAMMLIYGHTRHDRVNGIPFPIHYRQVLEECGTTGEAVERLRRRDFAVCNNVMLADRWRDAAVMELRTDEVGLVRADPAFPVLRCTNHFRTGRRKWAFAFTAFSSYPRIWKLNSAARRGAAVVRGAHRESGGAGDSRHRRQNGDGRIPFCEADVRELLQRVAIPGINLQRMTFRPESLGLSVAFGEPSTGTRQWHDFTERDVFADRPRPRTARSGPAGVAAGAIPAGPGQSAGPAE
jgi:hypothetical protein